MERVNDHIRLVGELAGRPVFSHRTREGVFWKFPLAVRRLSGTEDVLTVVLTEGQLSALDVTGKPRLAVEGEVRSFNNRSGFGPRLVITVLAREIGFSEEDFENTVHLSGTLCKTPILRRTPMGREICDMMLAVNRPCGRSDYLPCIAWGAAARTAGALSVGAEVGLVGRLQSRAYVKVEDGVPVEKTAYEVSALSIDCGKERPAT